MWLHFALFACLLLAAGLSLGTQTDGVDKGTLSLLVATGAFIAMSSMRAVTVGSDTPEYRRVFVSIAGADSLSEAYSVSRFEHGYVLLNYMISRATDDFNVFLLALSVLSFGSIAVFIHRYAYSNSVAVLLAFGMSIYYDVMLALRQGLAVALFLFSFPALLDRRPVRYVLLILLATQFHSSALILLPVYFITSINAHTFAGWLKAGAVVLFAAVTLGVVLTRVSYVLTYYGHYLSSAYAEGGIRSATVLGICVRIVVAVIAAGCGWTAAVADDASGRMRVLLAFVLLDIGVMTVSLGFNMLDRIEMYLTLPFVVGVANVMSRGDTPRRIGAEVLTVPLCFVHKTVSLALRPEWFHLFPYVSFLQERR
ncbi:EpsG family protein [Actinomyces ruminicola]|uniref:EpsG family protein n=1 Tax=Actinomyces ruminicola TaxID=332524 RepID=A0A1G9ZF94_9ACTO|nr:EpsG family protein [Actinomyces ruminicola]SDN19661.1 EpsG family protein [Actinomyces ruminicola]